MHEVKDALDFAGFKDVGVDSSTPEPMQNRAKAPVANETAPNLGPTPSELKNPTSSGLTGVLGWLIFIALIGGAYLLGGEDINDRQVRSASSEAPDKYEPPPPPADIEALEQRPRVGTQTLSLSELRWCAFWQ